MSQVRRLLIALALNGLLIIGQILFGLTAHSLGLLSDAAHNLTDAVAIGLAITGVRLSHRAPTPIRSYGWHRATILAALANATLIFAVTVVIMVEGIIRLRHPAAVHGGVMVVVALCATVINVAAALVLHERQADLNMRANLLHMSADAAASLGVAIAGAIIVVTGGTQWLDPAVSIAIAIIIASKAWQLTRAAVDVLLESTPSDINLDELSSAMKDIEGVADVHDIHAWSLSSGNRVLSAHVALNGAPSLAEAETTGDAVREMLADRFAIAHSTLELESLERNCETDEQRHSST